MARQVANSREKTYYIPSILSTLGALHFHAGAWFGHPNNLDQLARWTAEVELVFSTRL
jgi:hypothetical protein